MGQFDDLNKKFDNIPKKEIVEDKTTQIEGINNYDELKMYFGEDYWVTDKICIKCPTIGDIMEFGDSKFYGVVNMLCANPTSLRLQLWEMGIDWNKITDFQLFCILVNTFTKESTSLIFGDLNFKWFKLMHDTIKDCDELVYLPFDDNGNMLPVSEENAIIIDEFVYTRMVKYLRAMFNIHPKIEHAKNKATKEAMIWEDEENRKIQESKNKKLDVQKSFLLPLVSAMVNHPGFKYKTSELKEINIVQFMDSVKRLQVYESVTALMKGMYSGFVDGSQFKADDLNWLRDLNN